MSSLAFDFDRQGNLVAQTAKADPPLRTKPAALVPPPDVTPAPRPHGRAPVPAPLAKPPQPSDLRLDRKRDELLTAFGKATLTDRYLMPGESYQDMFARVACAYADDIDHAQRLYDAISKLWFMPSTPVLSNGGTTRGLPISCFLNTVPDSLDGIVDIWN